MVCDLLVLVLDFLVLDFLSFWWQDGVEGADYSDKSSFHWISVIGLPDFVKNEDLEWAVLEAAKKKHRLFTS